MAKINELIYDVREALKEHSDDSEISNRYIIYLYNIKRAKYLRQDLNNYQKTVDNSVQQSFCIKLEEVSINECNVDTECDKILRTVSKLPKPIDIASKVAINSVKPTNRLSIPFNFVSKDRIPYLGSSPYSKGIYSFLDPDGYIYLVSKSNISLLDCISITGVFENPLDLQKYSNCCDCDDETVCFDEAITEYPLQPHYIDLIKKEIVSDLLVTKQVKEDIENDGEDS